MLVQNQISTQVVVSIISDCDQSYGVIKHVFEIWVDLHLGAALQDVLSNLNGTKSISEAIVIYIVSKNYQT